MSKFAILHFNSIELYPPTLIDINKLNQNNKYKTYVFTTRNQSFKNFSNSRIKIKRYGLLRSISIGKYLTYIMFNILSLIKLLIIKPNIILVYETLSILPAFWYSYFGKCQVHIHYHELTSSEEINKSSSYYRYLVSKEKELLKLNNVSVSQTNSDRAKIWAKFFDYNFKMVHVFPNFPPIEWYKMSKSLREKSIKKTDGTVRLVHIGSLGLESIYLKEILEFVVESDSLYTIDFYTNTLTGDGIDLVRQYENKYLNISIKNRIDYFDIPIVLANYDIGLCMYKGHIPNYIYNVPNKIVEYLICGLKVWYSNDLITTTTFVEQNKINGIKKIDFTCIDTSIKTNLSEFNHNDYFTNNAFNSKIDYLLNEYSLLSKL